MVSYLAKVPEGATQTGVKLVRGDSRALQSVPVLTLDQMLPQLCLPITARTCQHECIVFIFFIFLYLLLRCSDAQRFQRSG